MIIPIVGPSALEFWLSGVADRSTSLLSSKLTRVSLPENYVISHQQEHYQKISIELGIDFPIHVMANRKPDRGHTRFSKPSIKPKNLPKNAFIQLSDSIYVSSPELCFVQMANLLPVPKIVEIANNLCAIYFIDKKKTYGLSARSPILDTADLLEFLNRAKGLNGIKKARQAIRYAADKSRSPIESQMAALEVLPFSQGGYGFPKPELNQDISLSDRAATLLKRESCNCDMVWMDQKVIVEYDSNLTHLSPDQHAYDKSKANALYLSGYKTFYATAKNLQSFKEIEAMFLTLREMLGLRPEKAKLQKYEAIRHKTVHIIMYDSWKKLI